MLTLLYVLKLARLGVAQAARSAAGLAEGLNVFEGHVTYRAVADSQGLPYRPILELLS